MEHNKTTAIVSLDGSNTLYSERFGENYRSSGGAAEESLHTFVKGGLFRYCGLPPFGNEIGKHLRNNTAKSIINIIEYGFGTGLNAYMTLKSASEMQIRYTAIDLYPLKREEYSSVLPENMAESDALIFHSLHSAKWTDCTSAPENNYKIQDNDAMFTPITDCFSIRKILCDFRNFEPTLYGINGRWIDVIYFDPFSPASEPECWSEDIFSKILNAATEGAVLTTYSAKGDVKRALRAVGWEVSRVPGSGTKRHNVVALNNMHSLKGR